MIPHEVKERQRAWELLIEQLPVMAAFKLAIERSRPPSHTLPFFANWKTWRRVLAGLMDTHQDLDRTARALGWLTLDSARRMARKRVA